MAASLPSRALDAGAWDRASDELVRTLRDLIRIPSINPPPADAPDGELRAMKHIADVLQVRPASRPRSWSRSMGAAP